MAPFYELQMNPIDAFYRLLARITLLDRWRNKGPGKVVESMPPEVREALTNLKSDELTVDQIRPKDYEMMGPDYYTTDPHSKLQLLEFEKKLGVQPPPRKKYGDYEGQ